MERDRDSYVIAYYSMPGYSTVDLLLGAERRGPAQRGLPVREEVHLHGSPEEGRRPGGRPVGEENRRGEDGGGGGEGGEGRGRTQAGDG